jgi:acetylglutamate kinase
LEEKNIEFSFINGQRVSSSEVRDVAYTVFSETNKKIVEALKAQGANATSLITDVFECVMDNPDLGYVGSIKTVKNKLINQALESDSIPVIAPLGLQENEILNINADIATVELVKAINPYKAIFLSEIGGIFNQRDELIPTINLALEYPEIMQQEWLHSGMKLKLEQIKTLLDHLPKTASVSITEPINLPKELFTDSGSGTLIKQGYSVQSHQLPNTSVQEQFKNIIEASFRGTLESNFFKTQDNLNIFMTSCKRATIAISNDFKIPYMDKFAVLPEAKGEGLGAGIWYEMRKVYPQVFWRSRPNNPVNSFYTSICEGCQKQEEWHIFWIGIEDFSSLKDCIEYALSKPKSVI